jgi:hypothetical protein
VGDKKNKIYIYKIKLIFLFFSLLLWVTEIFENERTRGGEEEKRL